jgi:hypothetical protein
MECPHIETAGILRRRPLTRRQAQMPRRLASVDCGLGLLCVKRQDALKTSAAAKEVHSLRGSLNFVDLNQGFTCGRINTGNSYGIR